MIITVLGCCGRIGQRHTQMLVEMGHKVYGVDLDHAWKAAVVPQVERAHGIADGSNAVLIATPADRHLIDVGRAVDFGCHIFVEKPICLIHETDRMEKALRQADERRLVVATGYNLRFHPAVMWVKDMIGRGHFDPMWGSFLLRQKPRERLGNFLEEWASHEIDLALHLLGPIKPDGHTRMRGDFKVDVDIFLEHDNCTSFSHIDAVKDEPFRRAFTLVDCNGQSVTRDIEKDHVQPEHYKAELTEWIRTIRDPLRNPIRNTLATGWEGLNVIKLLKRLRG